jgi:hypothetical protein
MLKCLLYALIGGFIGFVLVCLVEGFTQVTRTNEVSLVDVNDSPFLDSIVYINRKSLNPTQDSILMDAVYKIMPHTR